MSSPLYAPVGEVDDEGSSAYHVQQANALNALGDRSPAPLDPRKRLRVGDHDHDGSRLVTVRRSRNRRRYFTASIFTVTTVLLFADQNLMAPNLTAIAREFHFTDEERDRKLGGDIALAFFVLGAPASYLVGCLADSDWMPRSALFSATVGIGEGACLLTYFARTYWELYACRAVTGFSLGGALPLIYSFLGDLFSAEERHTVSALVGIGTGIGISFGQGLAGLTGPRFGWRLPFLLISTPALVCALLVLLFVKDPPRGGTERAVQDFRDEINGQSSLEERKESVDSSVEIVPLGGTRGNSLTSRIDHVRQSSHESQIAADKSLSCRDRWITLTELLSTPTVILALLQGAPGCVPWGIVNTYLNDFLSQNRGMTVESSTLTILFFGLGNFCGMLVGGFGGSCLYRRDCRLPALLAGFAAAGGCIPFWILLNGVDASTWMPWTALVSATAGFMSAITGPIIKATLQNVTQPQARGQAFALFNTFDDFGRGIGPVFVARMISSLGGRAAAFNVGVLGWAVCGFFNSSIYCTVQRDEEKVQSTLLMRLSQQSAAGGSPHSADGNERDARNALMTIV